MSYEDLFRKIPQSNDNSIDKKKIFKLVEPSTPQEKSKAATKED